VNLGLDGALDAPAANADRLISPGFVDTWNVRAAIETHLIDDTLDIRGGYGLRPTFVPDQTSGTNIVDNTAHTFACGATLHAPVRWAFAQALLIDVALQAIVLADRTTAKISPTDRVGSWTSGGVVHLASVGVRYRW
jgi:long-subunit fatty acid transport protein